MTGGEIEGSALVESRTEVESYGEMSGVDLEVEALGDLGT